MVKCKALIFPCLVSCFLGLALCSCATDEAAGEDSTQAGTQAGESLDEGAVAAGKMSERVRVPYSNGKARALLDKSRAGSLSRKDCLDAMDMLEQATEDVHGAMLAIVESSTSQVEAVENIGDREREFRDRYRYLTQLRQMMQSLPESCMGAELHDRFTRWDKNVTAMFQDMENRLKDKFPQQGSSAPSTGNG